MICTTVGRRSTNGTACRQTGIIRSVSSRVCTGWVQSDAVALLGTSSAPTSLSSLPSDLLSVVIPVQLNPHRGPSIAEGKLTEAEFDGISRLLMSPDDHIRTLSFQRECQGRDL